jgi:Peptidase M1 N-terminal domain
VDFNGGSIKSLILNGHKYCDAEIHEIWKENKLHLKLEHYLAVGEVNTLELVALNAYNKDQFGMVLVKDPNGDRYRYIQTVPYYASRIVPMFDQPNLKGCYTISIVHGQKDIGVTTGKQKNSAKLSELLPNSSNWAQSQLHQFTVEYEDAVYSEFETTPYLASYNLNLVCGPLVCFPADESQTHRGIPMNIYCRSKLFIYCRELEQVRSSRKGQYLRIPEVWPGVLREFLQLPVPIRQTRQHILS